MLRMHRALLTALLLPAACFTADLDPTLGGVFTCEVADDCPSDMACVNQRCESEDPPTLAIGFPEDEQSLDITEAEVGAMRELSLTVSGTLKLVPPGDAVFGEGRVEVIVDDRVAGTIESGSLSGVVQFPTTVENTLGAHRIAVRAIRSDGVPYDNEGAVATRLFFIDDGVTPLLGIKQPWPGAEFPLEKASAEVEVAVRHFSLAPAVPDGGTQSVTGHVHIYYNEDIQACLANPGCDNAYLATIVENGQIPEVPLPDSPAGMFQLNVVLRNIDHSLYLFPEDGTGAPIIDRVAVSRTP